MMKFQPLFTRIRLIILAVIVASASAAFVFYDDGDDFEMAKNLDIYYTLMRELNAYYVDEIDVGHLVKTGIDAMLQSLDPYTIYIPESRIEDYRVAMTGQYGGIGANFSKRDDYLLITETFEDKPAHNAGLRPGDCIMSIDGNPIGTKNEEAVLRFMKGQPGTTVDLEVVRPDGSEMQVSVGREIVKIGNVPYYGMVRNDVGYIKLTGFTESAGREVKNALTELLENKGAKSIVLDLRGNPGGLLIEAVKIVNLFVDKGQEVVSMRGQNQQWNNVFKTEATPIDTEVPLVVLVNSGSASASEIVSGALQDLDRAVIVGQRTFGKGLVQTTRPLTYNAQMKVTTAKYYMPSGRCIQALDYSNRNPDGSVGKVPDSLISEFETRNGRIVFDGGGVRPDVETPEPEPANITQSLLQKFLIFDYATRYTQQHDSILPPHEFVFTDTDYNRFVEFLSGKDYDYETEREQKLQELIEISKEEEYFAYAEEEFNSIAEKLAHDKEKDLAKFRDEIIEQLTEEIVSRYYFATGRIEVSLDFDNDLETGIGILYAPEEYNAILQRQ